MKIAVLGASRGLGAALVRHIRSENPAAHFFLSARKSDLLAKLAKGDDQVVVADFTQPSDQEKIESRLWEFDPEVLFYVAGGGPYGSYGSKKWGDHQWALELNLIFPAKLLHSFCAKFHKGSTLRSVVFVGSAIAGTKPDPFASSYAAAKHGLHGLIASVANENPPFQLRLFAPGYMDTDLLPVHAWPRQQGLAVSPEVEAQNLWRLSQG